MRKPKPLFTRIQVFALMPVFTLTQLLAACTSLPPARPGQPAVLVNPSAKITRHLSQQVSEMLGGRKVTLAPDALTTTSSLILDQRPIRSIAAPNPLIGRAYSKPDHFLLSLTYNRCVLTHKESGQSVYLKGVKCKAIAG